MAEKDKQYYIERFIKSCKIKFLISNKFQPSIFDISGMRLTKNKIIAFCREKINGEFTLSTKEFELTKIEHQLIINKICRWRKES
jgi:hypothetical protein